MTDATEDKKDVVPSQYREKYKESGGTCGDFIATELQKIAKDGTESLNSVKSENSIEADRWSTFNPGMQRMNLANVLRGRFLKGETISLLGKHYNAKDMAEAEFTEIVDEPKLLGKIAKFLGLQDSDRTIKSLQPLLFPKPKGPTAEERAAEKAKKEADKVQAKADKAAAAATDKAAKDAKKASDKAAKDAEKLAAKNAKNAKNAKIEAKRIEDENKVKVAQEAAKLKAGA